MPMVATPQGWWRSRPFRRRSRTLSGVGIIALIVLIIMGFNLICLLAADRIIKAIGPSGLQIIARVAGVLLTALAVQLMILGLTDLGLLQAEFVN